MRRFAVFCSEQIDEFKTQKIRMRCTVWKRELYKVSLFLYEDDLHEEMERYTHQRLKPLILRVFPDPLTIVAY